MKFSRTNKDGKFEVKKVKNKGAMSKNVVRDMKDWQEPVFFPFYSDVYREHKRRTKIHYTTERED